MTESKEIGIVDKNSTYAYWDGCDTEFFGYMNRTVFGTAEVVSTIDVPCKKADDSTCVYTMTLEKKLTISNPY